MEKDQERERGSYGERHSINRKTKRDTLMGGDESV